MPATPLTFLSWSGPCFVFHAQVSTFEALKPLSAWHTSKEGFSSTSLQNIRIVCQGDDRSSAGLYPVARPLGRQICCHIRPWDAWWHISCAICDDIAAIINAQDTEDARRKLNQIKINTKNVAWPTRSQLAREKTELLPLTMKHIPLKIDHNREYAEFKKSY